MENKAHAMAAGLFVLVVTAMLVALSIWLTRESDARRIYELSSPDGVTGLQEQAPVRYRGVSVGKVLKIGFDPTTQGNILVRIAVDESAPITASTYGSLGFQGVTGLAFVQLDDGGQSKALLQTDPKSPARIPMRPSLLSKLSDQGVAILSRIEETSQRVNLLLSPENQRQLMATIEGFGKTAASVQQLSERAQKLTGTAEGILSSQLGPERVSIPQFVQEATGTMKSLSRTSAGIDETAAEFRKSAGEITRLAERINAPGGVVDRVNESVGTLNATGQSINAGTLPRINRTSDDAARTARQVTRAVGSLSDNPQSLLFGQGATPPGPGEAGFVFPKGNP